MPLAVPSPLITATFKNTRTEKKQHHSYSIWLIASCINNSCLSNVCYSFISNLQLVCATRDILTNTELTFWYHIPTSGSYKET
jgi:hypothetical protein